VRGESIRNILGFGSVGLLYSVEPVQLIVPFVELIKLRLVLLLRASFLWIRCRFSTGFNKTVS